ncbi:MAG: hypothetical protein NC086_00105 [Alistipes sp.]|nr:hypothetical protein [Alistipes sp.]
MRTTVIRRVNNMMCCMCMCCCSGKDIQCLLTDGGLRRDFAVLRGRMRRLFSGE